MKALLMYRDGDFDTQAELPPNVPVLTQDLELNRLLNVMAQGDRFLFDVAKWGVLSSLCDPAEIIYRQHVLADCINNTSVVADMYNLSVRAIEEEKRHFRSMFSGRSPDRVLSRSVPVVDMFLEMLLELRDLSDEHSSSFRSDGFVTLFRTLGEELSDEYFDTVRAHLGQLRFRHGALLSAQLGAGNQGRAYLLHTTPKQGLKERILGDRSAYSFQIADRDDAGFKALSELRGRGANLAANALAQSADHILSFFTQLRAELGFYLGCANVHRQLTEKGETLCFPAPVAGGEPHLSCRGLYDVCLSLSVPHRVVGNDVDADGKSLVIVTGANQGGKSTFLRSIGLAQLLMRCGMFVGAESFSADVRDGVFTHFKREEDTTMESGKLDEELRRMSDIADHIGSNDILLCNESFAATNEQEGSEIARQIIRALLEAGVKVLFVTHMFDLANSLYAQGNPAALFLRAERQADGRRTFRMVEGEPLSTSFGPDLYRRIFRRDPDPVLLGARDRT